MSEAKPLKDRKEHPMCYSPIVVWDLVGTVSFYNPTATCSPKPRALQPLRRAGPSGAVQDTQLRRTPTIAPLPCATHDIY